MRIYSALSHRSGKVGLYSQTWQLVQHGGDRTQPSQSSVSSRPYSGQGYSHKPGPRVEHKTERETRQSSLAVYNRRCPCETQTALSNNFNVTKHYADARPTIR